MRHHTRYNILYFVGVIAIFGASLIYAVSTNRAVPVIIGLVILFLLPSVIQGFFWHDFFLGRRSLRKGQWIEAVHSYEKFLLRLKTHPFIRHLILLRWTSYTGSVEALTHSDIALARLNRGELEQAEKSCHSALTCDPLYPVPWFHLALVELMKGREAKAEELWQKSRNLGYAKTDFNQLKQFASSLKKQVNLE